MGNGMIYSDGTRVKCTEKHCLHPEDTVLIRHKSYIVDDIVDDSTFTVKYSLDTFDSLPWMYTYIGSSKVGLHINTTYSTPPTPGSEIRCFSDGMWMKVGTLVDHVYVEQKMKIPGYHKVVCDVRPSPAPASKVLTSFPLSGKGHVRPGAVTIRARMLGESDAPVTLWGHAMRSYH